MYQTKAPYKPLSVWLRIIISSLLLIFTSGLCWSLNAIKPKLREMGVFAHRCEASGQQSPCDDQNLSLSLMYQITVCGSQALSAAAGVYFQLFGRRLYTFTAGILFLIGMSGFGGGLILKDIPGLSDFLLYAGFLVTGFSGICLWVGFLSYSRDVNAKNRSIAGSFLNSTFDTSALIFFIFALLNTYTGLPLWCMFIVYGLVLGLIVAGFSFFMEPSRRKVVTEQPQDTEHIETSEPQTSEQSQVQQITDTTSKQAFADEEADDSNALVIEEVHDAEEPRPSYNRYDDYSSTNYVSEHTTEPAQPPSGSLALASVPYPLLEPVAHRDSLSHSEKFPDFVPVVPDGQSAEEHPSTELAPQYWKKPLTVHRVTQLLYSLDPKKMIPTLKELLSFESIIFHLIQSFAVTQSNFFQSTIIEQSEWISGNRDTALFMNNLFIILLPVLGTCISLILGPMLSRMPMALAVSAITVAWLTWNILSVICVPSLWWLQIFTFVFFVCSRAIFFIMISVVVYASFNNGVVVFSSIVTVSGTVSIGLAYLANYLAIKVFGGSFLVINIVYGGITTIFMILFSICAVRLDRKNKREEKQRAEYEVTLNGGSESASSSPRGDATSSTGAEQLNSAESAEIDIELVDVPEESVQQEDQSQKPKPEQQVYWDEKPFTSCQQTGERI